MKKEICASIACLAIGASISWGASLLGLGGFHRPGAGLFPFLIGCLISFLSLINLIHTLVATKHLIDIRVFPDRAGAIRLVQVVFSITLYSILLPYAGFLFCTLGWTLFLLRGVGALSWSKSLTAAIAATICFTLIFDIGLKIGLPKGFFDWF